MSTRIATERPRIATDARPGEWVPRWDDMAAKIVEALRLEQGERVVYSLDPYIHPELIEATRLAVIRAGAVEQGVHMNWSSRLARTRGPGGRNVDPDAMHREELALLEMFKGADAFIWLPADYLAQRTYTTRLTEWVLARWPGRSVHFHFFAEYGRPDYSDPVHERNWRVLERAILENDPAALRSRQERLVAAIRGRTLRVTDPAGTDLRVRLARDGWYHTNYGDASPERGARAVCARDREEELPPGTVRTLPMAETAEGIIAYRGDPAILPLDLDGFAGHLDVVFQDGRITELRAGPRQREIDAYWAGHTGDKDRLSEIIFGTNPLLVPVEGARYPTYWGYGEGVFRFHLGDILESGGPYASSFMAELWKTRASVEADGETIVKDGRLLID